MTATDTQSQFLVLCAYSVEARVKGDLTEAKGYAHLAISLCPEEPSGWHTLGMVLSDMGLHGLALQARQKAVQCLLSGKKGKAQSMHDEQQCVFAYANSLLLHGKWQEAWPFWEMGRAGYSWSPADGTTWWDGRDDEGGLVVTCEGGYGDLFLFSRFLPVLRSRYKGLIALFVHPGMRDVRDWRSLGVEDLWEIGEQYPITRYRWTTSLLSLPSFLGLTPENVPEDHLPFNPGVTPARVVRGAVRIGIAWRSEEVMTKRRFRSLNDLEAERLCRALRDSLSNHGVTAFAYSLCPKGKGLSSGEQGEFRVPREILMEPEKMATWRDTIRYVAGMDAVLTVDTAMAHVAGLLGVPTLTLLPLNTDWKWQLEGDTSLWYGPQFKLFRNRHPLEWEIGRIAEEFTRMVT